MALPTPPNYSTPIPNSPFYSPQQETLSSGTGPLVVGSGLVVNYATGDIGVAGGGAGVNIVGDPPIYVTGDSTNPTIHIETAQRWRLGVVQIGQNVDVDNNGVISVKFASTAERGVVQLVDGTYSISNQLALSARQGYLLQQQINDLQIQSTLELAGTFDPATSQMVEVTSLGLASGFVQGSNLPLPDPSNKDFYVIITEVATYTPPGSLISVDTYPGSWFLSEGSKWNYVQIGQPPTPATEVSAGVVRLATEAEAKGGTEDTTAITPLKLCEAAILRSEVTGKGALLTGLANEVVTALPVGTDGYVLEADSACPEGLKWAQVAGIDSIPCTCIQNCGSILVGCAPSTPTSLPVGLNEQFLRVNYNCPTSLEWVTVTNTFAIPCSTLTNPGDLITANSPGNPIALPRPSTDGSVLQVNTACVSTGGLTWVDNPYICCSDFPFAGQGSLLVSSCNALSGRYFTSFSAGGQPVGSVLVSDCNNPNYMKWCEEIRYISNICLGVVAGTLVTRGKGTAGNDWSCSLVPGADGTILTANSACDLGLEWAEPFCQTTAAETITSGSSIDKGESQEFAILPSSNYPVGTYLVNVWGSALNDGGSACMQLFFEGQPMQRIEYPNTRSEIPFSQTALVCNDIPANGGNACWYSCNSSTGAGPQTVNFYAYMTAIRIS